MVAVSINSSSLLFDKSAVQAEPEEPKTVYPTISGGINPLFFGNDGVHHYPRLGRDGETVVATDSHLLNVRPQLASFHGVYDWRWDAEHGDVARSVAAQLSMTHNGPQVVGIDRHGLFKISKLGGRRAGFCFVGGMERNMLNDRVVPEEPVAIMRKKYKLNGELIPLNNGFESLLGHKVTGLRDLTQITSEITHKPLDEVQLFLAAGNPSSTEEELLAAERAGDAVEEQINLERRRELARRELSALAKKAKSIPKLFKGRKSSLWSAAWKRFFRRREQFIGQGLISDPITPAQAAHYRKQGAYIYYSLAAARKFARLASRSSGKNRNVIITRQESTGHHYCLVNMSSKDPKNEVETWFAGRCTPSPYLRGDFKRNYSAVLRWAGGKKPESSYYSHSAPADPREAVPRQKSRYDHIFGTSFGNRWLDDDHLEVRKLPIGKGGFWSDFRAVTDEEAELMLQIFFGSMQFLTSVDSMIVQAVADDNERAGEDLVGGFEATPLEGEDTEQSYAWHEREFDAEADDYLQ